MGQPHFEIIWSLEESQKLAIVLQEVNKGCRNHNIKNSPAISVWVDLELKCMEVNMGKDAFFKLSQQ